MHCLAFLLLMCIFNGFPSLTESSLSDDWEKDFDDIEVTEEDLKNASVKLSSGTVGDDDLDEDWESWE